MPKYSVFKTKNGKEIFEIEIYVSNIYLNLTSGRVWSHNRLNKLAACNKTTIIYELTYYCSTYIASSYNIR